MILLLLLPSVVDCFATVMILFDTVVAAVCACFKIAVDIAVMVVAVVIIIRLY